MYLTSVCDPPKPKLLHRLTSDAGLLPPAFTSSHSGYRFQGDSALTRIREAIDDQSARWKKVCAQRSFPGEWELSGDSLKTTPRGYAKDHPLIEDLRRKDFVAVRNLDDKDVTSPGFLGQVNDSFKNGRGLMRFLCEALTIPF